MTTTTTRPLTPLERAILRAVVELGEEAYGAALLQHLKGTGNGMGNFRLLDILDRLEAWGYLESQRSRGTATNPTRPRLCWRPAIDLTDLLRDDNGP